MSRGQEGSGGVDAGEGVGTTARLWTGVGARASRWWGWGFLGGNQQAGVRSRRQGKQNADLHGDPDSGGAGQTW